MSDYTVRYKNKKFSNQKIELDGQSFTDCEFENCILVLERGETDISRCRFKHCQLLLRGNAYKIAKIIKLFSRESPLKVLDFDEPLFEKGSAEEEKPEG
jgi:hypothetical protein